MGQTAERKTSSPWPLLAGVGAVLVVAALFAGFTLMDPDDRLGDQVFTAVESRDLRFEDQPDGGVRVIDDADDRLIATLEPGAGGFTRSILRGLVRERRLNKIGDKSAFRLQRMANGGLMLGDPATGREVHLAAFGSSNVAAFERLMVAGGNAE